MKMLLLASAIALALTGCEKSSPQSQPFTDADRGTGSVASLMLRIDTGTGCHYLVTSAGGITPRLDGQGKHVGCKP